MSEKDAGVDAMSSVCSSGLVKGGSEDVSDMKGILTS